MKRRKRKKKLLIFIIVILLIIGAVIFMFYKQNGSEKAVLYSDEAVKAATNYDIDEKILTENYSKTLEELLINNMYVDEFFDEYLEIEYLDEENFLSNINSYLEIGYDAGEINSIFTLSNSNQEKLLKLDYMNVVDYLEISNYNADNTERYDKYLNQNEVDTETGVTYVNINLDYDFYTNVSVISATGAFDVLVNKYNQLPSDYVPEDLTSIPGYESYYLVEEAAYKIDEFFELAEENGYNFSPFSAYRSYTYQNTLFNNYVARDGVEAAETYSARAGHSEHQLGLAIDIWDYSYYYSTGIEVTDEEYAWIIENSYKYGFIVRYPKDSQSITGYVEEPWHLRYLGVELATSVYESGLTYDEYYDLYLTEY